MFKSYTELFLIINNMNSKKSSRAMQELSSYGDMQSLVVIEPDINHQSDDEVNIEVEVTLNSIQPSATPQELEERAAELRKLLDEPCSSEMASNLQKELNEVLMRLRYTPEGIIYDLDREYTVSELGSTFSSLVSERGEEDDSASNNSKKNKDTQESQVRPKRNLQDLDEYFKSDQLKKKERYSFKIVENEVDSSTESDQSNDQENAKNQSEKSDDSSDEADIMYENNSTESDESISDEDKKIMAEEEEYLDSVRQIIQNNDGEGIKALIENDPSKFLMATLALATENIAKLQDKGEQGKPTTKKQ